MPNFQAEKVFLQWNFNKIRQNYEEKNSNSNAVFSIICMYG